MEAHYKRYKGSQKEFSRWMVDEIEDFSPEIKSENPPQRFEHLPFTWISYHQPKKLVVVQPQTLPQHGPEFQIEKYWKQFSSQLNENIMRFLNLKDIIMLIETCKCFKEIFDQESMWEVLQCRDFPTWGLRMLKDDKKDRVSQKLHYKYLFLSTISGIPYHTGYFKTFGSPDVIELSESIVDFLCPKTEVIKTYVGEILARNQCKAFDLKLSWLKEKNEICLWNGNSSLRFKKSETVHEEVEPVNEFYPCFIKRYSTMVNEDEEITEVFFLEDKCLVVKLQKKEKMTGRVLSTRFRIINLEEELHCIAEGLEPTIPMDYSFHRTTQENKFGVEFVIDTEKECDINIKLLLGDRVVFYTQNSFRPTLIFWDLKEKKKIDLVTVELQRPLKSIILSKKSDIKLILLDEDMNVYIGLVSETGGFVLNQKITLPLPGEEIEIEVELSQEEKELEAKYYLNLGKKTRNQYVKDAEDRHPRYLSDNNSHYSLPKQSRPLDPPQFREKTRRYYHEIWKKTNVEWLILHGENHLYFINLDEGKIQDFSSDILMAHENWTIYEDNLLITDPTNIFYYKIDFEEHRITLRFWRETKNLNVADIGTQWTVIDPCFTLLVFTHVCTRGFVSNVTISVLSTQEFLYNQDPAFNQMSYKVWAKQFLQPGYKLERDDRDLDIKFENSKVLIKTDRASFYFDMNLSSNTFHKVYLNGWRSNKGIQLIEERRLVAAKAENKEEEEAKPTKQKMVNYMKLGGNTNTMNAKEKNNGWKKGGKSQWKKEEDKEYKVLKGKGDKYQKNIRQGQRSDKIN